MAFEIKYKQITSPYFIDAMHFLTTQMLPTKVAYNIKKMADKLESAKKKIAKEYHTDIVEKFAKKNPDGSVAHPKDPDGNEIKDQYDPDDSKKEEMKKSLEDFGDRVVKVDRYKLVIEDFGKLELSAAHLSALDCILTSNEELIAPSSDQKAG